MFGKNNESGWDKQPKCYGIPKPRMNNHKKYRLLSLVFPISFMLLIVIAVLA